MQLDITLKLDNAAFCHEEHEHYRDGSEIARILQRLASEFEGNVIDCAGDDLGVFSTLRDINGNHVGQAVIKE